MPAKRCDSVPSYTVSHDVYDANRVSNTRVLRVATKYRTRLNRRTITSSLKHMRYNVLCRARAREIFPSLCRGVETHGGHNASRRSYVVARNLLRSRNCDSAVEKVVPCQKDIVWLIPSPTGER